MATDLGRDFPPGWDGIPPHMPIAEAQLWRAWRKLSGYPGLRMWFDVGLGKSKECPPGTSEDMARMWTRLNQKRADAIIEHATYIELIEVRTGSQASALGRLLVYQYLLLEDNPFSKPLQLTLVTDNQDAELMIVARSQDITYIVV